MRPYDAGDNEAMTASQPPPPAGTGLLRGALPGLALLGLLLAGCSGGTGGGPATSTSAAPGTAGGGSASAAGARVVARDLDVPWGVAFLPGGRALVTERDRARVVLVSPGSPGRAPEDAGTVPGVTPTGEGGLLGIALDPQDPRSVFVYTTTASDNRVLRGRLTAGRLGSWTPVLTGIPRADHHDGGRIAFGPDGFLYVGTGDAGDSARAQDPGSLGGKILRVTRDGDPAPGNPDPGSPVWSLGHRNVEGLAWTSDGTMWATEFGQNTWDELNVITPGTNYGWPVVEGRAGRAEFTDPVLQWHTDEASPSGLAATGDELWMAALRGESVWHVRTSGTHVRGDPQRLLEGRYGRIRHVVAAPGGRLWVLTSNTFRGEPGPHDDRILSFAPDRLAAG